MNCHNYADYCVFGYSSQKGGVMRLGSSELILLVVLAVILFGGTRVAGLGKALGTSIREFKEEVRNDGSDSKADNKENEQKEEA